MNAILKDNKQMKSVLILLFMIFVKSNLFATEKNIRVYSEQDCKKLGLKPISLENGETIYPQNDGKHFFVFENAQEYLASTSLSTEGIRQAILATKRAGKIINDLGSFQYVSAMPIVINKTKGGVNYDILLDKLVFTPQGNYITVQAMISMPNEEYLCFEALDLKFTGQGGITSGSLDLVLGDNNDLEILNLEKIKLSLIAGKLNFGCNGFESFSIEGKVIFDRALIVPENPANGKPIGGNVESRFIADNLLDWNEMVFKISIQDFQLPNIPDYGFSVKNAIIDYSDQKNTPGLSFPKNYSSELDHELWKGVYADEVKIRFPKSFKKRNSSESLTIRGQNIIIDNLGFSGFISAENVLDLKSGELKGWDYSIESAMLHILKNKVKGGGLEGKIRLSINEEKNAIAYKAIIDPSRAYYNFSVSNIDDIEFDFIKASKVHLDPSSKISLVYNEGDFDASAFLNGTMNLGQKNDNDTTVVKISEVVFEKLFVSTGMPYLSAGYIGRKSSGSSKLANFDINITLPVFEVMDGNAKMSMAINVNLDKAGIEAKGGFFIKSKLHDIGGRHFWRLNSFGVDAIHVHADLSKFSFDGTLKFMRKNPVYGDGFYGRLSAHLSTNGNMGLDAVAMFGKSNEQKPYWMVDAQLLTGNSSKGLKIDFLAGSMYKNMAPSSKSDPFIQTLSGVTYEPNFSAGWGGRFAVAFSKGSSMAVAAGLEIQTRADGAISKIGFIGRAAFAGNDNTDVNKEIIIQQYLMMCKDSDLSRSGGIAGKLDNDPGTIQIISDRFAPSGEGGIKGTTASIIVKFDFENDSYYGKLGVSFTAPAFAIQAVGAFLSSPNKWFVHIGEPPLSSRIIIISPSLPPINGYFMIGDGIAALPDPQPNIFVKYPSKKGERNANIEPSTVATGRGIALGGAVFFQPPRLNILGILDFSVYAQAGFDFMLIKYDDGFYCSNRPGQPLGVNNWRAMGQLYAMASFAAKAFGFNVLSLDAGALLRAASPNPTYATGQVAVSFRALMKKFRFNVGFTLGEDCEVAKSDQFLENLSLIKTKFPEFGAQVSPNTIPKITGTEAFDKDIEDPSFEGKYQLKLNPLEVKTEKGEILAGTTSIKEDVLTFTPEKPFPAFQKVYMKSKAQVFLNQNGSLTPAQIEGGYVEEPVTLMFIATKTDAEMKDELEGHKAKIAADAQAIKDRAAEAAKQIQEKTDIIVNALNNTADSVAAAFIANCSDCSQAGLDSLKKIGGEMTTGVNNATANADSTIGKILKKALKEVDDVVDKAEKEAIEVLEKGGKNIEELQQKAKDELEQYTEDILNIYKGYCSSTFSWQGTPEGFRDSQIACLNFKKEAESKIKDKKEDLSIFYGKLKQDEVDFAINTSDQIMAKAQADCDVIMKAAEKECQTVIDELKKQCESIMQAASEKCKKIQGYSEKINMDEYIHNLFNKIDFSVVTDPGKTVINNCIDPSKPQIIVSNKNIIKGQSVNLTGSGCAINTTYLWNDTYIGANWSVTPNETQQYTLACKLLNCEAKKTFVTINVTADVPPADISGQNNSIASSGNNGSTQNNNENNSSSGSSNGNTETNPNPENTNQNNNVHHPCEGISNPNAWVSNSNVYVGTRVDLSANGCADGSQYSWTDLGVNAQSTSTTVEKSTYYNIKCVKTGCEDRWGGVYVEAIPPPADPCSHLASPSISGNSQINTGQQVSLGAYGCIAGSSYSWDTGDEGQNLSVSPNSSRYYTVTCIKSHCENQSASIYINVTDPCEGHHQPNVYADNYDVYYGQSTVLHASCPGGSTLSWDTGSSSADRTITINGNYVATARCTREGCETKSASITIKGLVPVSNNTNSNNNYNDYNSYNSYNSFINYSNYNANFYTNGYY